jgi:ferrous-iron efflux pump FieF
MDPHKAAGAAILVSAGLAIGKATIGLFTGSLVLLADSLDSAGDVLTGIVAFGMIILTGRQPDEQFKYGYYKAESLGALTIGILLIVASVVFLVKGATTLGETPQLTDPVLAIAAGIVSGVTALVMSIILNRAGKNSESLTALSIDRRKDFYASFAITAGIASSALGIRYVEAILTILLSGYVAFIAFKLVLDSVYSLMDASPDPEIEAKVQRIVRKERGILDFHKLRLRKAGGKILGQVDIKINKDMHVKHAHEIAESLKAKVKKEVPGMASFIIHVEPFEPASRASRIGARDSR